MKATKNIIFLLLAASLLTSCSAARGSSADTGNTPGSDNYSAEVSDPDSPNTENDSDGVLRFKTADEAAEYFESMEIPVSQIYDGIYRSDKVYEIEFDSMEEFDRFLSDHYAITDKTGVEYSRGTGPIEESPLRVFFERFSTETASEDWQKMIYIPQLVLDARSGELLYEPIIVSLEIPSDEKTQEYSIHSSGEARFMRENESGNPAFTAFNGRVSFGASSETKLPSDHKIDESVMKKIIEIHSGSATSEPLSKRFDELGIDQMEKITGETASGYRYVVYTDGEYYSEEHQETFYSASVYLQLDDGYVISFGYTDVARYKDTLFDILDSVKMYENK